MNLVQENEAAILASYLLKQKSSDSRIRELYDRAVELRSPLPGGRSEKILRFALRNKWSIGAIDSALAFGHKNSLLRQRLLIMTAILESQPQYASLFLPQERTWFYNIYIFWVGCRAVMKMMFGKFLLIFV
jgi:hypothetical protein